MTDDYRNLVLYAWIGEDELGSGEIGLKQGVTKAGIVPLVAVARDKLDRPELRKAMSMQSGMYGVTIRLARFIYDGDEVVLGEPGA